MTINRKLGLLLLATAAVSTAAVAQTAPAQSSVANPALWPQARSQGLVDAKTEAFVTELMAKMSIEEKVGQLIQADTSAIKPEDLRQYPLGSILAGGNSPPLSGDDRAPAADWVRTAQEFRKVSLEARPGHVAIPVIFGIDAVHGNSNVVGAVLYPHNVGLGATRDPDLIRRIGEATAQETAATGIDWAFGPTLATPQDDRWGRAYEGYSENPEVVKSFAGAMVRGLQGEPGAGGVIQKGHVAASAKHFLGDGGTTNGVDQGETNVPEKELIATHAQGYPPAINAGIFTIMASYNSWHGQKMHGNKSLLTDVLKGRMGFDGFVVGDWNGHGQVAGCTNTSCAAAINAGLDMFMAPNSWKDLYVSTLAQAKSGEIPMARIDDAVRRILRVKVKMGLFDAARPWEGRSDVLGSKEHRALGAEAVRKSLVLLKNNGPVLPIKGGARVLVAGSGADDISRQSGGWTLSWQGTGNTRENFPGATTIFEGVRDAVTAQGGTAMLSPEGGFFLKPDVAVVVIGETPYAEFQGDLKTSLEYQPGDKSDLALIKRLKAEGVPVVTVFLSGRPLWTNPEINASDAFVAAWLPGSEGEGVADVLIGDKAGKPRHDFSGKLSFSWPRTAVQFTNNVGKTPYNPQFAFGYGLSYARPAAVGRLSEDSGVKLVAVNTDNYFVRGKTPEPWAFVSRPASGVAITAIDADNQQEGGRQLVWNGAAGQATAAIYGPGPIDLTRQANGDVALRIEYRVDKKPAGTVKLAIHGGALDLGPTLAAAPVGEWRTLKIKLSCFREAGTDLTKVSDPFSITASGALGLTVKAVRLDADPAGAVCPAKG
jgi:beta-glucosidase